MNHLFVERQIFFISRYIFIFYFFCEIWIWILMLLVLLFYIILAWPNTWHASTHGCGVHASATSKRPPECGHPNAFVHHWHCCILRLYYRQGLYDVVFVVILYTYTNFFKLLMMDGLMFKHCWQNILRHFKDNSSRIC